MGPVVSRVPKLMWMVNRGSLRRTQIGAVGPVVSRVPKLRSMVTRGSLRRKQIGAVGPVVSRVPKLMNVEMVTKWLGTESVKRDKEGVLRGEIGDVRSYVQKSPETRKEAKIPLEERWDVARRGLEVMSRMGMG